MWKKGNHRNMSVMRGYKVNPFARLYRFLLKSEAVHRSVLGLILSSVKGFLLLL